MAAAAAARISGGKNQPTQKLVFDGHRNLPHAPTPQKYTQQPIHIGASHPSPAQNGPIGASYPSCSPPPPNGAGGASHASYPPPAPNGAGGASYQSYSPPAPNGPSGAQPSGVVLGDNYQNGCAAPNNFMFPTNQQPLASVPPAPSMDWHCQYSQAMPQFVNPPTQNVAYQTQNLYTYTPGSLPSLGGQPLLGQGQVPQDTYQQPAPAHGTSVNQWMYAPQMADFNAYTPLNSQVNAFTPLNSQIPQASAAVPTTQKDVKVPIGHIVGQHSNFYGNGRPDVFGQIDVFALAAQSSAVQQSTTYFS